MDYFDVNPKEKKYCVSVAVDGPSWWGVACIGEGTLKQFEHGNEPEERTWTIKSFWE